MVSRGLIKGTPRLENEKDSEAFASESFFSFHESEMNEIRPEKSSAAQKAATHANYFFFRNGV